MFIKTSYSILLSSIKVKSAISRLKELGYKVAVLADTELFGALEFFYAAKKEEITPIIACEKQVEGVKTLLIAKNGKGYKELIELISTSLSWEKISKTADLVPVIMTLPQDSSTLPKNTMVGISKYTKSPADVLMNKGLEYLAEMKGMKIIPLQIADSLKEGDYRATNALKAIGEEKLYENIAISSDSVNPMNYIEEKDSFVKSYPVSWMRNLMELINECSVDGYTFGNPTPPSFQFTSEVAKEEGLPEGTTDAELFAHMARKGLENRLKNVPEENHAAYRERLEYEIKVVQGMNFPGYLLIVQDFVIAAKRMGIPVGPGRGSAAGSLVAFAMEITNLDPIPYGLLFERFLNPERISMPDIDMDFCQTRRQDIIDYVIERYGKEQVAQIVTFGSLGAKGVIRDCSRILSYNLQAADRFSKTIPETPGISLEDAYEQSKENIDKILEDRTAQRVWKYANKLEGLTRNLGVHAAGLVITDEPVYKKAPLAEVNGTQVVQFDGKYLEDVNLIKFDFLGLKTLSVIDMAVKLIKENHNVDIEIDLLDLNDKKVYDLISTGNTAGIFQIESDGMQKLCKRMKPNRFEDLIALLALFRPGPMESGMLEDFVERKNGKKEVKYFFDGFEDSLKPSLEATYGVIVYQEQVMQIVQSVGGFSLGEADIIRRAMGKKNMDYMKAKASEFAEGAAKKGLNKENAEELFGLIEKFAGYGFNKSHSAAYAMVSFQTAWLKTYYPAEFLTALLNLDIKDIDKVSKYVAEAKIMGLEILPFDINTSTEYFETDGTKISFALRAAKGVGSGAEPCLEARAEKPFSSFTDFLIRSKMKKMNKRVLDALASSGALDSFGISRKAILEKSDELIKAKKEDVLMDLIANLSEEDYTLAEKIKMEKEKVGMYITDPFAPVAAYIDPYVIPNLDELQAGATTILVFPEDITFKKAKTSGKEFGVLTGYYNGRTVEALAFSKAFEQLQKANPSRPMILEISVKPDGGIFLSSIQDFTKTNLSKYFFVKG